jgi:C1A family cysteine protease
MDGASGLELVRRCLQIGLAVQRGLPLHPSLVVSFRAGVIPVPRAGEPGFGRHVVLAVGYDDTRDVGHEIYAADPARGALLIRNSWGEEPDSDGHGWLPYAFVLAGLTRPGWIAGEDCWLGPGQVTD